MTTTNCMRTPALMGILSIGLGGILLRKVLDTARYAVTWYSPSLGECIIKRFWLRRSAFAYCAAQAYEDIPGARWRVVRLDTWHPVMEITRPKVLRTEYHAILDATKPREMIHL